MKIVFDVDGTICFNGQYIEKSLVDEVKKLKEKNDIIFASARPIRDLIPVVKEFKNDILIGGNGSIISKDSEIEVIKKIPDFEFSQIKSIINKYNLKYIIDGAFNYSSNTDSNNKIYKQLDPERLAKNVKMVEIEEPIKIILVDLSRNLFDSIKNYFIEAQFNINILYHVDEMNIDITAKGIDKFSTLQKIIKQEPYIAYGNDVNDYALLKNANISYFVSPKNVELPFNATAIIGNNSSEVIKSIKNIKGKKLW
ncbi:TPA: HAD-IIB family hydrolase [Staphylococcus pseudintermedius]|nr:HAD-IIB family hydrolase [Staphylococcus pseudintermedius]